MHLYLKSLGFNGYKTNKDIKRILDKIQKDNKDTAKIVEIDGDEHWEIKVALDDKLSLVLAGSIDARGRFVREQAYPCLDSDDISAKSNCSIQRHISTAEYSGMLDDNRVGISLIFRLSNTMDYLERRVANRKTRVKNIYFSAWTKDAKVLLPVRKSKVQVEMLNIANRRRDFLIEQAKKGDESAIESLSMQDVDMYTMVNSRIEKEDLYSIVDTCFMPQGIECDIYTIIADILAVEERVNSITGEELYDLKVSCNNIILHLAVNKRDIFGEVKAGRRIKARVWLQARVEFDEDFI